MADKITRDIPTTDTLEMPLMRGMQLEVVRAYYQAGDRDRGSARGVWQLLGKMGKEIENLAATGQFKAKSTVDKLTLDHRSHFIMFRIMMAIPRRMMASLLRQTVAYDLYPHRDPIRVMAAPGIYVVTISVRGRTGMFLNRLELQKLIGLVKQYETFGPCLNRIIHEKAGLISNFKHISSALVRKHCTDVFHNDSDSDSDGEMTNDQVNEALEAFGVIDSIDFHGSNGNHKTDRKGCLWIKPLAEEKGRERLVQLVSMLRRRLGGYSEDDVLDPDDPDHNVLQIQAPMYVGCANQLDERVKIYNVEKDLRSMNKPMAFLVSAIHLLDLQPELKPHVVLRTWEDEQLDYAEVLVMALGRSLIWQDGTNRTQGGANKGKSLGNQGTANDGEAFVMSLTKYMGENLDLEEELVPMRKKYVHNVQKMVSMTTDIERGVQQLETDLQAHKGSASVVTPTSAMQFLSTVTEMQEKKLTAIMQRGKTVELAIKLLNIEGSTHGSPTPHDSDSPPSDTKGQSQDMMQDVVDETPQGSPASHDGNSSQKHGDDDSADNAEEEVEANEEEAAVDDSGRVMCDDAPVPGSVVALSSSRLIPDAEATPPPPSPDEVLSSSDSSLQDCIVVRLSPPPGGQAAVRRPPPPPVVSSSDPLEESSSPTRDRSSDSDYIDGN